MYSAAETETETERERERKVHTNPLLRISPFEIANKSVQPREYFVTLYFVPFQRMRTAFLAPPLLLCGQVRRHVSTLRRASHTARNYSRDYSLFLFLSLSPLFFLSLYVE